MFYWLLKRIFLGPILHALFRPWIRGEENVPLAGGAILASNHLSFSDSFFLPLLVRRRVTFLAKSDYFTGHGLKGRLTAGFFRGVGQLPVDRSGGMASEAALRTGLRVLRRGELMGIYPEGTRSPDGRLYRGKTGVARLALEAKVPVLPVVMIDTDKVQPPGRVIPRLGRVGVMIGAPLDFSRYDGMEDDRLVLRSITDEIMYELMTLSGQEYVDVYAATMKERIAASRRNRAPAARGAARAGGLAAAGAAAGADGAAAAGAAAAAAVATEDRPPAALPVDPLVAAPVEPQVAAPVQPQVPAPVQPAVDPALDRAVDPRPGGPAGAEADEDPAAGADRPEEPPEAGPGLPFAG